MSLKRVDYQVAIVLLIVSLFLVAGVGEKAHADTASPPPADSVGGRILGLGTICDDCTIEKVTSECTGMLEAPVFDRAGVLWLAGTFKNVIWRVGPDGHCTVGVKLPKDIKYPVGLRFAQDGTLYGVAMGAGLFTVDMPSKKVTLIATGSTLGGLPDGAFHGLNDIFIDHSGGMYLTDAAGSSVFKPIGQLFYRDAGGTVSRIISGGMMFPNGVVLSPNEKVLYIDETSANRILAVPVISPGILNLNFGYVFATLRGGIGPDSMTADSAGNIYAAHFGAGEVVVFAPDGDYYGAIHLPPGLGINPTNLAFHNGYLYITEAEQHTVWRVKTNIPGISLYGGS